MIDNNLFLNYAPPTHILANKIIVVTGAGDGIGKAAAIAFADAGATVVLLGRTLKKLEATYDEIEKRKGPTPAIFPINLESAVEHDYDQLRKALRETFGHVDGILHNAGEYGACTPINNYSVSEWHKLLQVNTTAPFLLTRALLPLLEKATFGRIVFTSANLGIKGKAYWGGYAVSKAASDNLMEILADELEATHIRVNSINPGAIRTKMRANTHPAEDPATVTQAKDIMNRYIYLMSDDSQQWNGLRFDAQSNEH